MAEALVEFSAPQQLPATLVDDAAARVAACVGALPQHVRQSRDSGAHASVIWAEPKRSSPISRERMSLLRMRTPRGAAPTKSNTAPSNSAAPDCTVRIWSARQDAGRLVERAAAVRKAVSELRASD